MANKQLNSSFRFNGQPIDKVKFDKRHVINLLPGVNQTETLQKFFGASTDHLFEPGASKTLNGYVGRSVSYTEADTNYYLKEETSDRQFYQLEPSMVSLDANNTNKSLLFYDDLINAIRFQGGLVNNHDRLFSQDYFSWCPSIDLDKFLNFREYYWIPEGPTSVVIRGHAAKYVGNGTTRVYQTTSNYARPALANQVSVTIDGTDVLFSYDALSGQVTLTPPPAKDSIIRVYSAVDSASEIAGQKTVAFENDVTLASNMKITLLTDKDPTRVGVSYLVEGVGEGIILVAEANPDLTLKKDHICIQRGCSDGNDWSTKNRWFHKSVLLDLDKNAIKDAKATRPIIEFDRNIQLFNSGTTKRKPVDLVSHSANDFMGAVNGLLSSTKRIDGVILNREWIEANTTTNVIRVLVINDDDSRITNRVYRVGFNPDTSKLKATLVADGADVSGAPVIGESVDVRLGSSLGTTNLYWNGNAWVQSQRKTKTNQAPLFCLYDANDVALDDASIYPNSSFQGCKLFGFQEDVTLSSVTDSVLGLRLTYDNSGEIVFENFMATFEGSYKIGVDVFDLPAKRFYKREINNVASLINDWYKVANRSRQMVVDKFVAAKGIRLFSASQEPVEPLADNLEVYVNNAKLARGSQYITRNNQILVVDLADDDLVEIRTYNPSSMPISSAGHYEIPLNLAANPKWEQVTHAAKGDLFEQFISVMRSQVGFEGLEYSDNNWKDIAKDLSLGTHIVSHSAPLLRTMLLSSSENIDFVKSAAFAQDEYARFRGKFDQKIKEYMVSNKLGQTSAGAWVDAALAEIAKGKTNDFPFYYSAMAQVEGSSARNFIPPTPSYLGVYPIQEPSTYVDPITGTVNIIGHDGSLFPSYGDFRDQVTLELEARIYASAPDYVRAQESGFFDHKSMVSTKFYSAEYSNAELNLIVRPAFEKWAVSFGINYTVNDTFDANDPFTWNWSSCVDQDNQFLPGHWRGIYNFYYGTDRPHTHPWEMLGFEYKPSWWEAQYGVAPYGSGNILMWRDIEAGRIVGGPTAGTNVRYAKPNLLNWLPVDDQGHLLDPLAANITNSGPRSTKAADDWVWGDGAPAESAWKQSFWYPFALAQACYLMKPPLFVETTWDITRNLELVSNQGYGFPYVNEYVHGELLFDGTIAYRHGTQQWIVDFLKNQNKDIAENLGSLIRGLDVKLAYKVGGFTESNSLFVVSDNIDRLPPEDVSVELYKSPSIREEFLGGVLVRKTGNYWKVFGYDILDPVFKIIPSDTGSKSVAISAGTSSRRSIPTWKQNTYYPANTTVRYIDAYYRCVRTHTSVRSFEIDYWVAVARPTYADAEAVAYYTEPKSANIVERVPYGSIMRTPQEVATFISGYERYLESRGWKFNTLAVDDQSIYNWKLSLKDFLGWAQDASVADDAMIALIPNSGQIEFVTEHGNVEPIEQIVNGVYSILDKVGNPIKAYNTNVVRDEGSVVIQTRSNQEMYAVRVHVSEIEHVIVVNNETIFGDVVYSPLFNIRQARLRLQGFKTKYWKGRVDAPGFLVNGNKLTVNFEKAADDFRRLFDIESIENSNLKDRARANTGYQEKEYLSNLLMTPTNQFEFHQGVIQQKGTISAMRKLFRSNFVRGNDGLNVLEEWGFRIGEYGTSEIRPSMDFLIKQGDFKSSPQLFQFNGSGQGGWDLKLAWDADHWDYLKTFETIHSTYSINGIKRVDILTKGVGYTEAPSVNVVGESNGASLAAILDWTNSGIADIKVLAGGAGFLEGDAIEIDGTGLGAQLVVENVDFSISKIASVELKPTVGKLSIGSGYKIGDTIQVVGGNGNGKLTVSDIDTNGGILGLKVSSNGAGYKGADGYIWPDNNSTADGLFVIKVSGGRLLQARIVNAGVGYDPTASARFTGMGKNAIVEITVTGAELSGIQVLNSGGGFEVAPTLAITGGNATVQATAVVVLQAPNTTGVIDIAKFKTINGVILKSFTVKVTNEFNGVQPLLTIGDQTDNARYVGEINLAVPSAQTFVLDDGTITSNSEFEIQGFVTNAQDSGNLEITFSFEYTPNYYEALLINSDDENITTISDLFNNDTGEFMHKDDRWVWRHDTKNPDWPQIETSAKQKGNLPSAGYVYLDDVQWTTTNADEFNALYRRVQKENPSSALTNTVKIAYVESLVGTRKLNIVPNLSQGKYRIKNFVVNVLTAFPLAADNSPEVKISIGTIAKPELFMPVTAVVTNSLQTYTHQVFEYLTSKLNDENALYVFVTQASGLSISPGTLTVTANLELIGDIVLPGDLAWNYNTGYGDWDVYRLGDTHANVGVTRPASFAGQGTIISTNTNMFEALGINHNPQEPSPTSVSLNPTFRSDIDQAEARLTHMILDGILPNNNTTEMLLNTYSAKFANQAKVFIDAASTIRTNGNTMVQIPIMDLWADSGVVINKITASVVRPFGYPAGQNPTLTVGTLTDPNRFLGAVNSLTAFRNVYAAPQRPTFSYSQPITLNVYDDQIVLNEQDGTASVRLLRSGNVFVMPTAINVTNSGWGYTSTSNPKITVLGPTGVQASAVLEGVVVGYAVTDAGSGYTSAPTITVVGGGGTGAKGTAVISNGKLSDITIPGAGQGTATAVVGSGGLSSVSLTGATDWAMTPLVTFEGGNPTTGAAVTPVMSGTTITGLTIDYNGTGYTSAPTVVLNPITGSGYSSEPRVLISGGGGNGATAEPIMIWRIKAVAIDVWGKCSWMGGESSVTIEAPTGGAPAQAELVSTPTTLAPTNIAQWRYRIIAPTEAVGYGEWVYSTDPVVFPAPTTSNSPDYYLQSVSLPMPANIDDQTRIEVDFPTFVLDTTSGEPTATPNVTNGVLGNSTTSIITINNTLAGSRDIDLKVAGTVAPFLLNERIASDNKMVAFYNSDGVSDGLITLVVDYHYTSGFELFDFNSLPVATSISGTGGDIFAWNSVRFANNDGYVDPMLIPVDEFTVGDRILLDDGRSIEERATVWTPGTNYGYHQLVTENAVVFRSIQSGSGLTASISVKDNDLKSLDRPVITDKGTLYTHEPTVVITGDGTGAEAYVTLAPTGIYKIKVLNQDSNSGYTGTEKILITPKNNGAGQSAEARISSVVAGAIQEVIVLDAGWGYDAAPVLTIQNDTSTSPVQLECVMKPVLINEIVMKDRGTNYTSASITFSTHGATTTSFVQEEWEAASEAEAGWRVLQLQATAKGTSWATLRSEALKIDSSMIDSAVIYDVDTSETLQTLQLYDPYKGFIPSSAKREISYVLEYDPAIYSNGPAARSINSGDKLWDSAKVGDVWWDLSTTRYLDYEIGSTDYKWKHWGELAPGITIDIYEWTRSTVSPTFWAGQVEQYRNVSVDSNSTKPTGTVKSPTSPSWVERTEFNKALQRNETVYYFWVKNSATLPKRADRKLTGTQIAQLIQDPTGSDVPWFAIVDTNKVIIGGAKEYVNDHSSSLKIVWKRTENDGLVHKQFKLLREADERNTIDSQLWNKMRDSLVGWDQNTQRTTFSTTTTTTLDGLSTQFSVADASGFDPSGEIKIGNYWVQYAYLNANTFYGISGLGNLRYGVGTIITQTRTVEAFRNVPDQWLNERERYGSLSRPAQTWFRADTDEYGFLIPGRAARKTFVETMNEIFAAEPFLDTRYEWSQIFTAEEIQPDVSTYFKSVDSEFERDQLSAVGAVKAGQKILMQGTPNTNGLWTLWIYLPDDARAIASGFVLLRAQRYRFRDGELWTSVDWYDSEWSQTDYPVKTYATIKDRDADINLDTTLLRGTLVRVDVQSPTDTRWAWYVKSNGTWKLVAKERATIRLNSNFYDAGNLVYGFNDFKVGSSKRRDGSWELQFMLDSFATTLLTGIERNKLFFSMVKTAVSQHNYTDWVFKTSFLYLAGYNEQLTQSPITFKDQIDNILAYIDDVKPYHVKVRDFVRRLTPPRENLNVMVTDFDKPQYYDQSANNNAGGWRKLDINNPVDATILKTDPQMHWWYDNYKKANYVLEDWNDKWNPVRRPEITMLFDRVSCKPIVGWSQPETPWDGNTQRWIGESYTRTFAELEQMYRNQSSPNNQFVVDGITLRDQLVRDNQNNANKGLPQTLFMGDVATVKTKDGSDTYMWSGVEWVQFYNIRWDTNSASGAADRIDAFYEPTAVMKRKNMGSLIRGCEFTGTVVEGGNMEQGLWDLFEWDFPSGWDNEFEYYVGRDLDLNPTNNDWSTGGAAREDINLEGGEMDQPWFGDGRPDELARVRIRNPITITVYRKPDSRSDMTSTQNQAYRFFKDSKDTWNAVYLAEDDITLTTDMAINDLYTSVTVPNTFELHDPSYLTNNTIVDKTAYADMLRSKILLSLNVDLSLPIKASVIRKNPLFNLLGLTEALTGVSGTTVVNDLIKAHVDAVLAQNIDGVIWVGYERITYKSVVNNGDGTYELLGLTRGTAGTPRYQDRTTRNAPMGMPVYDGSILHALLSYNVSNMRTQSVTDYSRNWKSWNTMANSGKPGPTA